MAVYQNQRDFQRAVYQNNEETTGVSHPYLSVIGSSYTDRNPPNRYGGIPVFPPGFPTVHPCPGPPGLLTVEERGRGGMRSPERPATSNPAYMATTDSSHRYEDVEDGVGAGAGAAVMKFKGQREERQERKGRCQRPPCWGWILIAITACLLLVSITIAVLLARKVKGSSGMEGNQCVARRREMVTDQPNQAPEAYRATTRPPWLGVSTSGPRRTTNKADHRFAAKLLMECEVPQPSPDQSSVDDLCWVSFDTLVAIQSYDKRLIKIRLVNDSRACSVAVIEDGFRAVRLACTYSGDVYVTEPDNNRVRIYTRTVILTGSGDVTRIKLTHLSQPCTIAFNMNHLIIGSCNEHHLYYIYTHQLTFISLIHLTTDSTHLWYTTLTESGVLVGTTTYPIHSNNLIMHDVEKDETWPLGNSGSGNGQLLAPAGVCEGPADTVLVSDYCNDRISVFRSTGHFLYHLQYKGGQVRAPVSVAVSFHLWRQYLLAISTGGGNKVIIGELV